MSGEALSMEQLGLEVQRWQADKKYYAELMKEQPTNKDYDEHFLKATWMVEHWKDKLARKCFGTQ